MQAKYTVVLYDLLNDPKIRPLINQALSTFPMYISKTKAEYIPKIVPERSELIQKLLNHYKYREIGFETVGRFIDELEISMCEIMPYYNQLFFTADQDYNIIYNVDYQRTIDSERSGSSEGSTHSEGSSEASTTGTVINTTETTDETNTETTVNAANKSITSNTPQDSLDITAANMESVKYADKVDWNKSESNDNGKTTGSATSESNNINESQASGSTEQNTTLTNTNTGTESTLETTKGNFGVVSAQDLIQKYRDIILNIEQMIINDDRIKELFMMVF